MVSPASFEEVATRYAAYIHELRDFFAGRNVRFGSPQDIIPFAERLGPPSFFRDEMSSLVRAIVYREREGVSRPELLELVAIAVGGSQIENRAKEFERSLDQVSEFLGSALRSLWGTVPDELPEQSPEELLATQASAHHEPAAPITAPSPATTPSSVTTSASPQLQTSPPAVEPPMFGWAASGNGILSRALSMSSDEKNPEPGAGWTRPWLLAVCALVVVVAALLYYGFPSRHGSGQPDPSAEVQPASGTSVANTQSGPAPPAPGTTPAAISSARDTGSDHTSMAVPAAVYTKAPARRPRTAQAQSGSTERQEPSSSALAAAERAEQSAAFDDMEDSPARGSRLTPPGRIPKHDGEGVFFVSSGLMTDHLLSAPAPDYPRLAKLTGVQGPVVMQVVVSPDGGVSATRVLSGHWLLRSAAEHAVRRWTYRPYMTKGRATDISTIVTVNFRLHR